MPSVLLEPGQIIRVSSRQYLVEDVILPDSPVGISNPVAARAIRSQFEMLVTQKILYKLSGL